MLPDYRRQGVAARLKWAQRVPMLAVGIDLITWTFDPLEAPNARLNLHTLGTIVSTYGRNLFQQVLADWGAACPAIVFKRPGGSKAQASGAWRISGRAHA